MRELVGLTQNSQNNYLLDGIVFQDGLFANSQELTLTFGKFGLFWARRGGL